MKNKKDIVRDNIKERNDDVLKNLSAGPAAAGKEWYTGLNKSKKGKMQKKLYLVNSLEEPIKEDLYELLIKGDEIVS